MGRNSHGSKSRQSADSNFEELSPNKRRRLQKQLDETGPDACTVQQFDVVARLRGVGPETWKVSPEKIEACDEALRSVVERHELEEYEPHLRQIIVAAALEYWSSRKTFGDFFRGKVGPAKCFKRTVRELRKLLNSVETHHGGINRLTWVAIAEGKDAVAGIKDFENSRRSVQTSLAQLRKVTELLELASFAGTELKQSFRFDLRCAAIPLKMFWKEIGRDTGIWFAEPNSSVLVEFLFDTLSIIDRTTTKRLLGDFASSADTVVARAFARIEASVEDRSKALFQGAAPDSTSVPETSSQRHLLFE